MAGEGISIPNCAFFTFFPPLFPAAGKQTAATAQQSDPRTSLGLAVDPALVLLGSPRGEAAPILLPGGSKLTLPTDDPAQTPLRLGAHPPCPRGTRSRPPARRSGAVSAGRGVEQRRGRVPPFIPLFPGVPQPAARPLHQVGLLPQGPFFCSNYLSPRHASPPSPASPAALIDHLVKTSPLAGLGEQGGGGEEEERKRCNYSLRTMPGVPELYE